MEKNMDAEICRNSSKTHWGSHTFAAAVDVLLINRDAKISKHKINTNILGIKKYYHFSILQVAGQ